ncbi:MAG: SPOR domain-containing protein, partial [Mucilaginibacter sp.]
IRCCIFFMAIFLPAITFAQTRGKVEVIKDPLIDTLMARRASLGAVKGIPGAETGSGYRVQIFFGSSRQAAYDAQAKFNEEYPEYRTYVSYTEPNFKVRAGDFRTRLEAQKLAGEVRSMFTSIFIISDRINLPKTDQPND